MMSDQIKIFNSPGQGGMARFLICVALLFAAYFFANSWSCTSKEILWPIVFFPILLALVGFLMPVAMNKSMPELIEKRIAAVSTPSGSRKMNLFLILFVGPIYCYGIFALYRHFVPIPTIGLDLVGISAGGSMADYYLGRRMARQVQ